MCPNDVYFLAKKYKTDLGIQRTDLEIPERPHEYDFDALPNDRLVHVRPRLLVTIKKKLLHV